MGTGKKALHISSIFLYLPYPETKQILQQKYLFQRVYLLRKKKKMSKCK